MAKDYEKYHPLRTNSDDGIVEVLESPVQLAFFGLSLDIPWRRRLVYTVISVQGLLNIVLVAVGLYYYAHRGPSNPLFPQALYSPAQDVVSFKIQKFYEGFGENITIYQKGTSDEVDKAWEDLYSFGISEVPRSVAEKMPNKTYPLVSSDGNYITELDVFHQLHCLNTLRMALTPDYYRKKNLTDLEKSFLEIPHAYHCLDALRQSLTCNADIATYVWHWDPEDEMVKPTGNVVHSCRDFDKLKAWAIEHHIHSHFDNQVFTEDDLEVPIIRA